MALIHWLLLAVYFGLIVLTIVKILLDNRQPSKTMAWLLVLMFLPIIGLLLYYFFGQNTRKERMISNNSLDQLSKRSMLEFLEQKSPPYREEYKTLVSLFQNQNGALPFKDNQVEIYTTGYEFFLSLLAEIGRAEQSIHIESFIFEDDPLGNLVADALIDKARQGVEVRVIYDDVGCWKVHNRFFERMKDEGIEVHAFMPVKFPAFTSKMNYRDHRKLIVIDGETAFIGGMNIALRYVKGDGKRPWRDTHLRLKGRAVYGVQREFLVAWYFCDGTLITNRRYYPDVTPETLSQVDAEALAQVVTSSPIAPWPDIEQGYVRILLQAKHYVYMETPYFLPTEPILFAMRVAALAGVDVRLMVPSVGDSKIVDWASRSFTKQAVEAGVKVLLYKAGFNHTKMLISDDYISTCGSTNLDFRSFEHDFESNIFFFGTEMAKRFRKVFEADEQHCDIIGKADDAPRQSLLSRLWESLNRLLSPLL